MKPFVLVLLGVFGFSAFASTPPTGRYKDVVDGMQQLAAAHPHFASVFSIGVNDDDVEIYAMRVSLTPKTMDKAKIGQIVVSTHHGNELAAPLFTMNFLRDLLSRYESRDLFRGDLAQMEWTIVPVLNISGYNLDEREEHNIDPNRDWEGPCPSTTWKLKSIRNLRDYVATRVFAGSVTVHGYDGSFTYPWGMYVDNYVTLDDNLFASLFAKAAAVNNYKHGNGALLIYPANGCYEDYMYWKYGTWSLLLELLDGSDSDIQMTTKAIAAYFDEINSSPSVKNQFSSKCTEGRRGDLRVE